MLWRYLETTLEFAFLFVFVRCIFAGIANVTVNIMKLREPDCKLGSLFFDLLRVGTSYIKSAGELITRGGNCILFLLRFVGCAVLFSSSESLFCSSECSWKKEPKWCERTWLCSGVCVPRTSCSGSLGHTRDSPSPSTLISRGSKSVILVD